MMSQFRSTRPVFVTGIAIFMLVATAAFGQGIVTGSISGTVQDPQGAYVVGAKITATQVSTNRPYQTVSTSAGVISLRGLPPGAYQVKVESPNFRSYEIPATVAVGSETSLGIVRLEVGASSEVVNVEATTAPLLEA